MEEVSSDSFVKGFTDMFRRFTSKKDKTMYK